MPKKSQSSPLSATTNVLSYYRHTPFTRIRRLGDADTLSRGRLHHGQAAEQSHTRVCRSLVPLYQSLTRRSLEDGESTFQAI